MFKDTMFTIGFGIVQLVTSSTASEKLTTPQTDKQSQ